MNNRLLWQLQVSHVGGVLLAWVIQLTALTQSLVIDRQGYRLHVHELVVRDGRLAEEELQKKGSGKSFYLSPSVTEYMAS